MHRMVHGLPRGGRKPCQSLTLYSNSVPWAFPKIVPKEHALPPTIQVQAYMSPVLDIAKPVCRSLISIEFPLQKIAWLGAKRGHERQVLLVLEEIKTAKI